MKYVRFQLTGLPILAALAIAGCKDDSAQKPAPTPTSTPVAAGHGKGEGEGKHANAVTIGETTVSGLKILAKQDEPVAAGGEGAFDFIVTGYPAGGKPKSVRLWVGVESGEGSVKAKAEEESPDNWHSHVEVPKPIPAGAKFWAEVEPATGKKFKVSFEFKTK